MRKSKSCPARAAGAVQGARTRSLAALFAVLVLAGARAIPSLARAGITVSFGVPSITVTPGTDFDVELVVSPAGSGFNAFDAVIGFDPALLTAVTLSPLSSQDG